MVRNGRDRGGNNGGTRERTFPESFNVSANSPKDLPKNRLCLTYYQRSHYGPQCSHQRWK